MKYNETNVWEKLISIENDIYTTAVDSESVSLMQGIGGLPILYDNLFCTTGNKEYIEKNDIIINKIIDLLGCSINSLKYYDGLSGLVLLFDYLLQKGFNNYGFDEIIEDSKDLLYEAFLSDLDNLDFLHGAQGIFMIFLYQHQGKESDKRTKLMMKSIIIKIKEYIKNSKEVNSNTKINCGLAHGLISYILILSKYLEKNDCRAVREVLNNLVNVLLETESKNESSLSIFPSIVDSAAITFTAKYIVPLGWCYGDNIISLGLLKAGIVLQNNTIIEKAKQIAVTTTKRNSISNAIVHDACFCHGTSSIAHSYNKWYKYTCSLDFKNSYEFWIDKTIEMCSFENGIGGYKQFTGINNLQNNIGLLDGACGVALVLLDFVNGKTTNWDRFFLLE